MADKEKFIKCDCHSEGMLVTKFDDEEELYFSYWREGINPIKLSWWIRLKLCWMVLTKGNVYDDQVILNKEKAIELASWILLNVEASSILEHTTQHGGAQPQTVFGTGNLLDRKPLDPALEQDKTNGWGGV
jgi:hypothetical protein